MKIVAALLVAAFVLTAGPSFAFGDCPGHSRAQMVKSQPQEQMSQEQMSKDQPAGTPFTVAEKTEPAKPEAKPAEKK